MQLKTYQHNALDQLDRWLDALKEARQIEAAVSCRCLRPVGRKEAVQIKEGPKMMADLHALPIGERIQLVEDIWDSIAADQALLPLTADQRAELDRRLDAYESDNMRGREVSEVVATLKKRL